MANRPGHLPDKIAQRDWLGRRKLLLCRTYGIVSFKRQHDYLLSDLHRQQRTKESISIPEFLRE